MPGDFLVGLVAGLSLNKYLLIQQDVQRICRFCSLWIGCCKRW